MKVSEKPDILIVDDNKVNQLIMENRLDQAGYHVVVASGGKEALELLGLGASAKPGQMDALDAVVLDIMMPDIDGMEVLSRIREVRSPQELPVIMATALDQSESIVNALGQGSNDYVTKPIDMAVLLARLRTEVTLKRTHQALKKAQNSLIEAAKMESVGYLAAGVAHEVRNPLAQIQMGVEAIGSNQSVKDDANLQSILDIVKEAVKKADSIINDLVKVSVSRQFELKPHAINDLIQEEIYEVGLAMSQAGIRLETDLGESLPMVPLAATELKQALAHVLANAIDAMRSGGTLTVRTSRAQVKDAAPDVGSRSGLELKFRKEIVMIEVLDTGQGIARDNLPVVFDPFFTTKSTGPNTGLGLSVARKVIQLHHGLIAVENRKEETGVRVVIHLPASGSKRMPESKA